jgi:hypothetical protein
MYLATLLTGYAVMITRSVQSGAELMGRVSEPVSPRSEADFGGAVEVDSFNRPLVSFLISGFAMLRVEEAVNGEATGDERHEVRRASEPPFDFFLSRCDDGNNGDYRRHVI